MRVKVDEDLPKAAVEKLRERGYEAISVVEQGLGGLKDPALWQAVQDEQRFLVTADKGFADIRFYAPVCCCYVLTRMVSGRLLSFWNSSWQVTICRLWPERSP